MPELDLPIKTERLLLRPFTMDDLDAFADLHSRPEVVRHLYTDVRDRDEVRAALTDRLTKTKLDEENDTLLLAVDVAGELAGDVLLHWTSARNRQGEIGFVFHPDHQGRGYAAESAREMLRIGFTVLDLHRIVGRCDARNTASYTLLERLGMRREALLRQNEFVKGEWCDEMILGILRSEWSE